MRYSSIDRCECTNGKDWGISLFTQGCPFNCKGCHNMSTWSMNSGEEYTQETEEKILELIKQPHISRFSILGGEPFLPQNMQQLYNLVTKVHYSSKPDIKIWLWTGTTLESIFFLLDNLNNNPDEKFASLDWDEDSKDYLRALLPMIDYLIDGRFIQEQKDLTLKWRGSSNQRVLDCKESMRQFKPILADI